MTIPATNIIDYTDDTDLWSAILKIVVSAFEYEGYSPALLMHPLTLAQLLTSDVSGSGDSE
jgi:hypothetical protein